MIYQSGFERGESRERSRDAERKHNNRSPSEDSNYRKYHPKEVKPRGKRVKYNQFTATSVVFLYCMRPLFRFEEDPDVKIFRKEDEPSARGLLEQQILNIKNQIEKEIAKSYDFNWQHFKHRDALSESNSMKQQKQKEKALVEKLMSAKQTMSYFYPPSLRYQKNIVQIGSGSSEREGHTLRIHDILGCYYTHVSQIPNQPQFQILNTNTSSESKLIKFDNDMINDSPAFGSIGKKNIDNAKNIKGILKVPGGPPKERGRSETIRTVDPQLIFILKDAKLNPNNYSKERVEALLKPYKDSGELEYLMKNKEVLQSMLRNTSVPVVSNIAKPTYTTNPTPTTRDSTQRGVSQNSQISGGMGNMGGYGHAFVPKADKYRTVPCKYYHSPQGCSKIDNCTFIHDEKYAGQSVPMNSSNSTMSSRPYAPGPSSYPSYPPMNPINTMNPMIPPNIPPNYYGSVGYPSNSGYYPSNRAGNSSYQGNGYGMQQQYGQAQQGAQYVPGQPGQYPQGQSQQAKPYGQGTGNQYGQSQSGQYNVPSQQYSQAPQVSQPPPQTNQAYNNPNYQYYIGNNPNK